MFVLQVHEQLVKMTGHDVDPKFEMMWQYGNGTLPEYKYEEAIKCAIMGFDALEQNIRNGQSVSIPKYLNARSGNSIRYMTCCSCGFRANTNELNGRDYLVEEQLSLLKYTRGVDDARWKQISRVRGGAGHA